MAGSPAAERSRPSVGYGADRSDSGAVLVQVRVVLGVSGREEQALLTTIAGLVVVLFVLTREIGALFDTIKQIFGF